MAIPRMTFSLDQFSALFPFHFILDEGLKFRQLGPSLMKVCPEVCLGDGFQSRFQALRPLGGVSKQWLGAHLNNFFLLRNISNGLQLRGGFLDLEKQNLYFFTGSPWLLESGELLKFNLQFSDFSVHDPVLDMLEVFQASKAAFDDAMALAQKLKNRGSLLQKANAQLEASEHFTRATLDALKSAIVVLDEQGVVVSSNRAAEELAQSRGFSPGEFAAGSPYLKGLLSSPHAPPAAAALVTGIGQVIAGKRQSFELEYDWHLPDKPQWFLCRATRFAGEGPTRVVVSNLDNTQIKLLQDLQARSQRMESLGTLAGGIAHDLNNALAPIVMGLGLLGADTPDEERLIDTMRASGQRAAGMVRQLLTFSKGTGGERRPLRIKPLLLEIQKILTGTLPKDIQLIVDTTADLTVLGDATQLHQVLLNLCLNARDAMPRGGKIVIREELQQVDELFAAGLGMEGMEAKPGSYAVLTVTDTGTGMTPEVIERMFEPFFTTKGPDKGTGLGLSTVLGIVKSHQGFLQVRSKLGEGTSFSVYIPVREKGKNLDAETVHKSQALHRGNGETVLLVDDEAPIREIGAAILKRLNYNPVMASNGLEGLVKVAELRKELRVVITDLAMPDLNGIQFVQAVRHSMPNIPIIVASGTMRAKDKVELEALNIFGFLDKPFTEEALAHMLGKMPKSS